MAQITFDPGSIESYRSFLKVKSLPSYNIRGMVATFPDEYIGYIGGVASAEKKEVAGDMSSFLFDYQQDITRIALRKRKYALFIDCGYGKSLIYLEYIRHVREELGSRKGSLIIAPLMVVDQLIDEARKFYPGMDVEKVPSGKLDSWASGCGGRIGITNYEAFNNPVRRGQLGCVVVDEASMLKSHYGKWSSSIIETCRGVDWKLPGTGTPAPNDRIEYANQAVFLDQTPTVNAFLATYFINRGQTSERWALKDHALEPFYRGLSHWSILMSNPGTYGWKDNAGTIPPINFHIHYVDMTEEQRKEVGKLTGCLIPTKSGGIASRGKMSQIGKGHLGKRKIASNKPGYIRDMIDSWKDERSTLVWCKYNEEQDHLARTIPDAASMDGKTKIEDRLAMIRDFKEGSLRTLISKPKILGFGLNLQVATKQVFSTLMDCFDEETEVLTKRGWIGFGELSLSDEVATSNPGTLNFEWQSPSKVVWEPYSGDMVRFYGERNFDLLVTPNHRMFVKRCDKRFPNGDPSWHFRYAGDIVSSFKSKELRMQSLPLGGFSGESPELITNDVDQLLDNRRNRKSIPEIDVSSAVLLAGWYLSEGYCRPKGSPEFGRIVISQTDIHPESRDEIIQLLGSLCGSVNSNTKDITCYSRHLAEWLMREFGHGSYDMKMPPWLKSLSFSHLIILRDTMMRGDGISGGRAYRTASRRLADDFQEVCLKTGWRASVKSRIGVCEKYPDAEIFDVCLAKSNTQPSIFNKPTIENYSGMIGCATVPNGTLVVRRNGVPVVTGNSYEDYYQCVKRSNRVGSTHPLDVHAPITEIEAPMLDNVLAKADRIQQDTDYQEGLFKQCSLTF